MRPGRWRVACLPRSPSRTFCSDSDLLAAIRHGSDVPIQLEGQVLDLRGRSSSAGSISWTDKTLEPYSVRTPRGFVGQVPLHADLWLRRDNGVSLYFDFEASTCLRFDQSTKPAQYTLLRSVFSRYVNSVSFELQRDGGVLEPFILGTSLPGLPTSHRLPYVSQLLVQLSNLIRSESSIDPESDDVETILRRSPITAIRTKASRIIQVFGNAPLLNTPVHQDLRGENLIIDPDGKMVVIDFGSLSRSFALTDPLSAALYNSPTELLRGRLDDELGQAFSASGFVSRAFNQETVKLAFMLQYAISAHIFLNGSRSLITRQNQRVQKAVQKYEWRMKELNLLLRQALAT